MSEKRCTKLTKEDRWKPDAKCGQKEEAWAWFLPLGLWSNTAKEVGDPKLPPEPV
jgi:hypothetical protein